MSGNPYHTRLGVVERAPHLVHLCLRDTPEVASYQVWGSRSVDGVYGDPVDSGVGGAGPVAMFTVPAGGGFRSPSLRRSGRGQIHGSTRGQAHMAFDPDDFLGVGVGLPPDEHWLFIRVQEGRRSSGLLALAGVPETTVTLGGVLAGDTLTVKGIVFEFAAGANSLAGKAGTLGDPFIVGLGANDAAAAANLTLALNDNGDVSPAMDGVAPINTHTFATNVGAPSAVVLIQPEDAGALLLAGLAYRFSIASTPQARVALDASSLSDAFFGWVPDANTPVLGPILCLPSARYFGNSQPTFTLQGTAPSNTGSVAGQVPNLDEDLGSAAPRPMYLLFPHKLSEVYVRNISLNSLLVSFGPSQPMMTLAPSGGEVSLASGNTSIREVLVACPDAGGAAFTIHAAALAEGS